MSGNPEIVAALARSWTASIGLTKPEPEVRPEARVKVDGDDLVAGLGEGL